MMTGGDALVQTLLAHGVTQGCGLPGESYLAVLEGLTAVARAYGPLALSVKKTSEFADGFAAALTHAGPALFHVTTDLRDVSAAGPLPA